MFGTVFSFELKRWFKSWVFYLYLAIFFAISFLAMMSTIGVFDAVKNTSASLLQMNSAYVINSMLNSFNMLLYFLFPSIIGMAIYRDYKYNVHHIYTPILFLNGNICWVNLRVLFLLRYPLA